MLDFYNTSQEIQNLATYAAPGPHWGTAPRTQVPPNVCYFLPNLRCLEKDERTDRRTDNLPWQTGVS